MRINRYVARATGHSRRQADELIKSGKVTVNGSLAPLGYDVSDNDVITLDGNELELKNHVYVLLHKPVGYVSSRARQGGQQNIYDLLPETLHHLKSVGRLDRDSSGAIIMSDDGDFAHEMTHPKFKKRKLYKVTLDKTLSGTDVAKLNAGVKLADGVSHLKILTHQDKDCVIEMSEGRNRQIRRTFSTLGYNVVRLHREEFGEFMLEGLKPGAWRYLDF